MHVQSGRAPSESRTRTLPARALTVSTEREPNASPAPLCVHVERESGSSHLAAQVEGYEPQVLQTAARLFSRYTVPSIQLELTRTKGKARQRTT